MAKATAKKAAKPGKAKPAGPKPVRADVPLGEIDPGPAYAVRAGTDREAVERYKEATEVGEVLPPVDLYAYKDGDRWVYLMPDGGHRYVAHAELKRKTIAALVRRCKGREEAEALSLAHSLGTNATHGLPRSKDDKRAVVATALRSPLGVKEDRPLAGLCGVSRHLVRFVREELTRTGDLAGKASADGRYKDSDSDYAQRAKGIAPKPEPKEAPPKPDKPRPDPKPEPVPSDDGDATGGGPVGWRDRPVQGTLDCPATVYGHLHVRGVKTCGELADALQAGGLPDLSEKVRESLLDQLSELIGDETAEPDPAPAGGGRAATPAAADELGRPVPDDLLAVFAERRWFRSVSQTVGRVIAEAEAAHKAPHGAALTMNPLRVDGENLSKGIAGAMPYCVCPDHTPAKPCDGKCKHCSGRGWLSRLRFGQLPNAKRAFAESFSKQDAA